MPKRTFDEPGQFVQDILEKNGPEVLKEQFELMTSTEHHVKTMISALGALGWWSCRNDDEITWKAINKICCELANEWLRKQK